MLVCLPVALPCLSKINKVMYILCLVYGIFAGLITVQIHLFIRLCDALVEVLRLLCLDLYM